MSEINMADMNEDEATLIVKQLTDSGYVIRKTLPDDNLSIKDFPYVAGSYKSGSGHAGGFASIDDAAKSILGAAKNGWFGFYPDRRDDLSTRQQLWVDSLMSKLDAEYLEKGWA
jgi:hypothetical protein